MKPNEYIKKAKRTAIKKYPFKKTGDVTPEIEHSIMGIVTEAGELMDEVKKAKIYGKKLDKLNLIEELGDLMWYIALILDHLEIDFETVWEKNINKLKVRYPKKFTENKAKNRNLEKEKNALKI